MGVHFWGLKAFKDFYALIPLVGAIGVAVTGSCSFMAYSLAFKPDVRVVRSRGVGEEGVEPGEVRKLYVVNPDLYKSANPEIDALRKEISRSYKA